MTYGLRILWLPILASNIFVKVGIIGSCSKALMVIACPKVQKKKKNRDVRVTTNKG